MNHYAAMLTIYIALVVGTIGMLVGYHNGEIKGKEQGLAISLKDTAHQNYINGVSDMIDSVIVCQGIEQTNDIGKLKPCLKEWMTTYITIRVMNGEFQ